MDGTLEFRHAAAVDGDISKRRKRVGIDQAEDAAIDDGVGVVVGSTGEDERSGTDFGEIKSAAGCAADGERIRIDSNPAGAFENDISRPGVVGGDVAKSAAAGDAAAVEMNGFVDIQGGAGRGFLKLQSGAGGHENVA